MKTIPHLASPCAAAVLILLAAGPAETAPVRYRYDDTGFLSPGGWSPAGVGEFTIDIGTALGDYAATDVAGGPGSLLGLWSSVIFSAQPGDYAWLYLFDPIPNSFGIGVPGIGGSNIDPNSSADAEWAHFLSWYTEGSGRGIVITPLSTPDPVPESSSLGWGTAVGLGLALLCARRRG